jgi:3-carboxy-cis,cis-muconate cycloisomerase
LQTAGSLGAGSVRYGPPVGHPGGASISHERGGGLFSGISARGRAAAETTDAAVLQAMLDFELALMRALVSCELAPPSAVTQLAAASSTPFDLAELGRRTGEQGTPVPGLLSALRSRLPDDASSYLHTGATSQDVVDSALMLVAQRALDPLLEDLTRAAEACAGLAEAHRRTAMAGRTLLQQAVPMPFGLKAAVWLDGLEQTRRELAEVRDQVLAAQFGGAVGSLGALGDRGLDVARALAGELGLPEPPLPWHTMRVRPARLAAALGIVLGVMGKIARDLVLLAQTEVAEAAEGGEEGRGGSSTMPQKRNPVGAVAVLACAGQAPGLVASVLGAMTQEHERGAGSWQAEWEPQLALLRLAGSAADALAQTLAELSVDPEAMRANLALTAGAVMSESVVSALTPELGRAAAQKLVAEAARRAQAEDRSVAEVLRETEPVVSVLSAGGLDEALDPERYRGASDAFIDRAVAGRSRS